MCYILIPKKESTKEKERLYMLILQKCVMTIQKLILINPWLFQIIEKASWVINMILLIFFLFIYIIMMAGLKMKNRLMQQERVKKESVDLSDMPLLKGDDDEKVKKKKRIKNFNSKQIINKTSNTISTNNS